jgi:hypothetical protein
LNHLSRLGVNRIYTRLSAYSSSDLSVHTLNFNNPSSRVHLINILTSIGSQAATATEVSVTASYAPSHPGRGEPEARTRWCGRHIATCQQTGMFTRVSRVPARRSWYTDIDSFAQGRWHRPRTKVCKAMASKTVSKTASKTANETGSRTASRTARSTARKPTRSMSPTPSQQN